LEVEAQTKQESGLGLKWEGQSQEGCQASVVKEE
jgi:hypothetical protein